MGGEHTVRADIGVFPVGVVDVIFDVKLNAKQLGKLNVSQGGVEWKQRDKKNAKQLTWAALEKAFLENGHDVKAKGFELRVRH